MKHTYNAHLIWDGNLGDGTSSYVRVERPDRARFSAPGRTAREAQEAAAREAAIHATTQAI